MRCDKCGKKFDDFWVPSDIWPQYKITERLDVFGGSPINLCDECSRKLKEWLEEEDETKTDRCK